MKLKIVKWTYLLLEVLTIASAVLAFFGPNPELRKPLLILAGILLIVSSVLDYQYWRCPHCGAHLGRRMLLAPQKCHNCGHEIHMEEAVDASYWREQQKKGYPTNHKHDEPKE